MIAIDMIRALEYNIHEPMGEDLVKQAMELPKLEALGKVDCYIVA